VLRWVTFWRKDSVLKMSAESTNSTIPLLAVSILLSVTAWKAIFLLEAPVGVATLRAKLVHLQLHALHALPDGTWPPEHALEAA
jgi:hypothetical protein